MKRILPLFLLFISTHTFGQDNARPNAQPARESVATLKKEIERLKAENAQLRGQLQALGPNPNAVVAQPAKALPLLKQLPELIAQIPADKLPTKDAEYWNELTLKITRDWINKNLVGRKFQVTAESGPPLPKTDAILIILSSSDVTVSHFRFTEARYSCLFPVDQASAIARKKVGATYTVEGTIERIEIYAATGERAKDERRIRTFMTVSLKDCRFIDEAKRSKRPK